MGARDEIFFPLLDLLHIEALQQRHERVESSARVSEREVKSIPVLAVPAPYRAEPIAAGRIRISRGYSLIVAGVGLCPLRIGTRSPVRQGRHTASAGGRFRLNPGVPCRIVGIHHIHV